jgi:hypothetical protein
MILNILLRWFYCLTPAQSNGPDTQTDSNREVDRFCCFEDWLIYWLSIWQRRKFLRAIPVSLTTLILNKTTYITKICNGFQFFPQIDM